MTWTEPSSRSVIEKALSLGEAFPLISGQTLVRQFGIQIEKHLKIKSTCNCFIMDKKNLKSCPNRKTSENKINLHWLIMDKNRVQIEKHLEV